MNDPFKSLIGTVLDGDLIITARLGRGGMGTVYRGRQRSLNRDVCIKLMLPELAADLEFFKRFRREAKVLASLHHPNVIEVYSFGRYQRIFPYLVMELVDGSSLRQVLQDESTLDWQRTCIIIRQVCQGLSAVHKGGFTHRDLKPDNILLSNSSELGTSSVKIIDFGLTALAQRSTLTATGDLMGSIHYMAPECYAAAQHGKSVDVYAVGCILFECLTGQPPFNADSPTGVLHKHINELPPDLPDSSAPPEVRKCLQAIYQKCCAKSASDRFKNCDEIAVFLETLLTEDLTQTSLQSVMRVAVNRQTKPARHLHPCLVAVSALAIVFFAAVSDWNGKPTYVIAMLWCQHFTQPKNETGLLNAGIRYAANCASAISNRESGY